jgi:Tol biopolymer transport system component
MYPVWSRDGTKIAYVSASGKQYSMFEIAADGSGSPKLLLQGAKMIPNDWSPDGQSLLYMDFAKGLPTMALYFLRDGSHRDLFQGAEGQFSPDGEWVSHVEPGVYTQVWIERVPFGARVQISGRGGAQARWSRDGSEVFYIAPDRKLMSVKFDKKTSTPGPPMPVFQTRIIATSFAVRQYDVSANSQKFIVNSLPAVGTVPLSVLTGWAGQTGQ